MKLILCCIASLMLAGFAFSQEAGPEPVELTKLRQQFQGRVDQEMAPWREKYLKELQKLEDRFVQERKLAEALAVKNERAMLEPLSANHKQDGAKPQPFKTNGELKRFLKGTLWVVYAVEDKKRENPLDVYQFIDADQCYVLSAKAKFPWAAKSGTEAFVNYSGGEIELVFDVPNSSTVIKFSGKTSVGLLVGRPDSIGK